MAKYYGTHTCGHEGVTNVTGPSKNRQWIVDKHFERLCSACYEEHLVAERARINAEAEKKAKEMELPILTGSDKQVQWANTLRQNLIDEVEKKMEKIEEHKGNRDLANQIFTYILTNKTQAVWYIENRLSFCRNLEILFRTIQGEMPTVEEQAQEEIAKDIIKDIKSESTVYPENAITNAVADIEVKEDHIIVRFEKNEKFIGVVKKLNYTWDGVWKRSINTFTGTSQNRAAELGNQLLNAGFPICIIDENTRNMAINGEYEPECNRWIVLRKDGNYEGWLTIKWTEKNDKLYNISRKLPGSKWDNGTVVKIAHYKEVEDFAGLYEFKFSNAALAAIEDYKNNLNAAKKITPAKIEPVEAKDGLKEILKSEIGVLSDLMDED